MTPHPSEIEATQLHQGWLGRLNFGVVVGMVVVTVLVAVGCAGEPEAAAPESPESSTTTIETGPIETGPDETTTAPTITPTSTLTTTTLPPTTLPPRTLDIAGEPMIEFSIDVGDGVDLERSELVAFVIETLTDPRGWRSRGAGFRLVEDGGSFTLMVATPDQVDDLCAPLQTNGYFSCARNGYVALNGDRWFGAVDDWPSDLTTYRRYLVNHEIGHYLVGPAHPGCPATGCRRPS